MKVTNKQHSDWVIQTWYEKVIYVVGYISVVVYVTAFVIGFVAGLAGF
jgi:hypothetical protein